MRFDYTDGKKARYIVSIYSFNINDHCYYSNYKEAKDAFNRVKDKLPSGTLVSVYDLKNDVCKDSVECK